MPTCVALVCASPSIPTSPPVCTATADRGARLLSCCGVPFPKGRPTAVERIDHTLERPTSSAVIPRMARGPLIVSFPPRFSVSVSVFLSERMDSHFHGTREQVHRMSESGVE